MSATRDPRVARRLVVVGVGLIGGSVARALKAACAVGEVVGVGRCAATLARARSLGVIDRAETSMPPALAGADLVVVATPVGAMPAVFAELAAHWPEGAVVTDVGSVKGALIDAGRTVLGPRFQDYVPAHPIAGGETAGVEASRADLFAGRTVVLTPVDETAPAACARVRALWAATGASCVALSPQRHDEILALTSHLPHLLAFSALNLMARGQAQMAEAGIPLIDFVGSGFRDFSRIGGSDPVMWRDICLTNREALLRVLDRYQEELATLEQALRAGNATELLERFAQAQALRRGGLEDPLPGSSTGSS